MAVVAVAGNVNGDVSYVLDRMPVPGETLLAGDARIGPGGKASNQSVALAKLGASPLLIGCVGDDPMGQMALSSLAAAGVDTRHVLRNATAPTGLATVFVNPAGENAIVTALGANMKLGAGDVPELDGCEALLLTLGLPMEALLAATAAARRAQIPVIVDTTPLRVPELPRELTEVDVLSANSVEAEQLSGVPISDIEGVCAALRGLGARAVVVKLGAGGAAVDEGEGVVRVPAPSVKAVDPTGAGDAFMAALTVRLVSGESAVEATRLACAAGAAATTVRGAQGGFSTLHEVERLLK